MFVQVFTVLIAYVQMGKPEYIIQWFDQVAYRVDRRRVWAQVFFVRASCHWKYDNRIKGQRL